jgi:DNA mismatch repair protein MutS2
MHAESVLEFESLRTVIARYVRSALGRAELDALMPVSDRAAIGSALADAAEGIAYLRATSQPQAASSGAAIRIHFHEIADPGTSVARLRIEGATLEATEIFEIARMLDLAAQARSILVAARERFPRLARHASGIADLRDIASELRGKILPDGSVADHASVALARLRRDGERQRHKIHESLERLLRAHHEDGTLQEDFVTIRDDRFVVPVVTGRERRVDGVIHGARAAVTRFSWSPSKPSSSIMSWSACAKKSCARCTASCASLRCACGRMPWKSARLRRRSERWS